MRLCSGQECLAAPEADNGWGQVANGRAGAAVVVFIDEDSEGGVECAPEEVVFQPNAGLEGLVPTLDLALLVAEGPSLR